MEENLKTILTIGDNSLVIQRPANCPNLLETKTINPRKILVIMPNMRVNYIGFTDKIKNDIVKIYRMLSVSSEYCTDSVLNLFDSNGRQLYGEDLIPSELGGNIALKFLMWVQSPGRLSKLIYRCHIITLYEHADYSYDKIHVLKYDISIPDDKLNDAHIVYTSLDRLMKLSKDDISDIVDNIDDDKILILRLYTSS